MKAALYATSFPLRRQLDDGLARMGIDLDESQRERLLQYVALLEKWNKVYNLTAVREPDRMVDLHLLDSLSILPHLAGLASMIDVGTGGGLPGIPLAVANPTLRVTMLDSISKKTAFVRQTIGELRLKNADVITSRVEDFVPDSLFDAVISRAFAELKDFVDSAGRLCADEGVLLAMKGVHPHDEIGRLPVGYVVAAVVALNVPGVESQRHLVVIKKN